MKFKKIKPIIFALLFFTAFGTAGALSVDRPVTVQAAGDSSIQPRADIIEWRYKTVNGVLYRRQYNTTTGKWLGSWTRVY